MTDFSAVMFCVVLDDGSRVLCGRILQDLLHGFANGPGNFRSDLDVD